MSFRKSLFKNIIILGGYSYSTKILGFLSSIVLSRLLLPSEYGFVALIYVFTGFINEFADAGLSYLVVRSDYKSLFYSAINYLSLVIGIILCIIVILLAYPIAAFYKDPALIVPTIVMSTNFVLRSATIVPYGILSKRLDFNKLGFIDLVNVFIEIVLMITLAYLKFSYWALIIPTIIGNISRIAMFYSNVEIKLQFLSRKYLVVGFRKAKSIIGNLTGFNLLNYWARNSDNMIIGKFYGSESLGIYNRAYKMLELILGVMTSLFGKVLYPSLKEHSDQGGDVNHEYLNTLGIISLLNFPIAVVLIFFAEPMVTILWSKTWIQVADLLPYIGILILTQTLNSTTGNIFILYGKEKTLMRIGIPTSLVIIGAIALGAIFSMTHVLLFYSLAFVSVDIPFVLYYGFKKSFGFETPVILKFWLPKVILSILVILSVFYEFTWITAGLLLLYLIHLIIEQKADIKSTFYFLLNRIKRNK